MDWKELGKGAALALYRNGCMVAVITGPHIDGYMVSLKASSRNLVMPDLAAAKARAEREVESTDTSAAA